MSPWNGWPLAARLRRRAGTGAGPAAFDRYVERLSQRLYQETLDAGGWAAEIGVFGPSLFRSDAQRLVHEIALGSAVAGPPSP